MLTIDKNQTLTGTSSFNDVVALRMNASVGESNYLNFSVGDFTVLQTNQAAVLQDLIAFFTAYQEAKEDVVVPPAVAEGVTVEGD